jgi:GAF domain-containing protein
MKPCHVADLDSALKPGELAFALGFGGRLSGALVCAARTTQEPYDPDEIALLKAVAGQLSVVLETIRARISESLVEALAAGLVDANTAREQARAIGSRLSNGQS